MSFEYTESPILYPDDEFCIELYNSSKAIQPQVKRTIDVSWSVRLDLDLRQAAG